MGFFNFVKSIGKKVSGAAKILYGGGKSLLKTGVSIGSKIINNPIVNKAVDFATPFLSTNPYGRAALMGIQAAKGALRFGENLSAGIDKVEGGVKSIEKIRKGDFSGGVDGLKQAYSGIRDTQNKLKGNTEVMKSAVIGIKNQFS